MRRLAILALVVSLGAACKTGPADTGRAPDPTPRVDPQKEAPPMTDLDPKSPAAWQQAEAIAATAAKGKLQKRSDALPFLFMAENPPSVLVHKGKVVRDRGAKVAGEYLRDLGIIEGRGPAIEDVLYVLHALDGWPPVKDVPKESYVHAPGDASKAEVTAKLRFDGVTAEVTLVYFLGDPVPIQTASGSGSPPAGSRDPNYRPTVTQFRKAARCTLVIPASGDPAWKIEQLNIPA